MSVDDELERDDVPARDLVEVSSMQVGDLNDLVRIDAKLTGRDRRGYMARKLDEALLDSGVRVSLTARRDALVVGFLMARIDFGDAGHAQPTAVIDTIGVDPGFSRVGVGKALLSQLLVNLRGLQVEQVETTLAQRDLGLLGFLYRCGFAPSERIALEKSLG